MIKNNQTIDGLDLSYTYNVDKQIKTWIRPDKVEMKNGDKAELFYDALCKKVHRKEGSEKTAYLWDHPTALNQIIARAVEGDKNKVEYYHKNYLDHVYAVSNDSGTLKEHYRYTAFGEPEIYSPTSQKRTTSTLTKPNTILWNSRRHDPTTNLYYYKYRHYSPTHARFLTRDPIEEIYGIHKMLQEGANKYIFTKNDSINDWDVLGLHCFDKIVAEQIAIKKGKEAVKLVANSGIRRRWDGSSYYQIPEYCGFICCDNKTHKITDTGLTPGFWKDQNNKSGPACQRKKCPKGSQKMFGYHSHPHIGYAQPSPKDKEIVDKSGYPEIVSVNGGRTYKYEPDPKYNSNNPWKDGVNGGKGNLTIIP